MSIAISGSTITFSDLSTQSTAAITGISFKNKIINGDMRVRQRGSSASLTGTHQYLTMDRWVARQATLTTATGFWSAGTSNLPLGFQACGILGRPSGGSNVGVLEVLYAMETTDSIPLQGQIVTVSFYAKAGVNFSSSGNLLNLSMFSGTGTDQSPGLMGVWTGVTAPIGVSQQLTTSWQRYSFSGTVPSNCTQIGLYFNYTPTGTASGDDSFYITGVQLEASATATEFERRPIGTELALCQRYYDKSYSFGVDPATSTTSGMVAAIQEEAVGATWYSGGDSIKFTTEMRRAPDFAYYDNAGTVNRFSSFWNGAVGSNINPSVTLYVGTKAVGILEGAAGPSGGRSGSPLVCHYTASAEL
jgi:hypothetical protein